MQHFFAVGTILLMIIMVVSRTRILKKQGVEPFQFGKLDKTDFLIPPMMLFYFYMIFAAAFELPSVSGQEFFQSEIAAGFGVGLCAMGLVVLLWSLISFGKSFRIGIDIEQPDKLVTSGIFAYSRNPIYLAFGAIVLGQFLIFSNWILLTYFLGMIWLFHRQVLREEEFLQAHYGDDFTEYCYRVRRYL